MADDNVEDTSQTSSHPFFVRGGFPFVFLPTTFQTGFTFANNHSHDSTTESKEKKENEENNEEVEAKEEEGAETIDDDEADHTEEKDDVRISQPKYSQLLKELDFSHTRMVDVTNLLPNELDQPADYLTAEENENPPKVEKKVQYESSSGSVSSVSSDEELKQQTSSNKKNQLAKDDDDDDDDLMKAADEIENDLNDLAAIIHSATKLANEEEEEISEHSPTKNSPKKNTFDEDDDTSKQATQNYDLHDNEQEDIIPSSKSSKIPRLIRQRSSDIQNGTKSSRTESTNNQKSSSDTQNQMTKQDEQEIPQQPPPMSWDTLVFGNEPFVQPLSRLTADEPIIESHTTPKQQQPIAASSEEKSKTSINSTTKQRIRPLTSSSSSDTNSFVEHTIHRTKQKQPSSSQPKQTTPPKIPHETIRQDSQATLIDENLDELSSQIKQVLIDQERQTTSTKEERTTDGMGSMSFPLSTPDILSTDVLDNDISNRPNENVFRRLSTQQRQRQSNGTHEHSIPHRKKPPHHHQRHSVSRHSERHTQNKDDDWLTMLEKLEREHKARLEKQQQQYKDYMHTLESKMKRRFDDYLTLTNGFQESRLDDYNDTVRLHRTHTSIPIDSNIGRYKTHSYTTHRYRPLARDLVSHYYPADSTLNILTSDNKRTTSTENLSRPKPREEIINLREELSDRHAKYIDDLKLYYEYEINELKSQLNRTRMGNTSSSTRQSMETIERINDENIRLHDQINELRHSLKMSTDENVVLKKQLEELREQLNTKDIDLKNYHRTISDLEQQLSEAENTKERQDEKYRHAERQILLYQEESETIKADLLLTRERLLRLEERYHEQENENETLRRQIFMLENDGNRIKNRMTDDHKLNSTMPLNIPTSREYGHFALSTGRHSSSTITSPRDGNFDSSRYQTNATENLFHHTHSPRPMTRITDYLNDKPAYPQPYIAPSRNIYSPRKSIASRRVEPVITRQTRQNEQLEQKFDQLLKKKRDLETRISRIPIRGLTATDRQLYDVLEREIERVEQQISSVKLELRKLNVFRTN